MPKIFKDKNDQTICTVYETNEIQANPETSGNEQALTSLQIGNMKYNVESGGSTVIPNPEIVGEAPTLTGLQINGAKYKVPQGGGGGSDYTAGEGIEISNDVISVDRASVQKKLVAGDDIVIEAAGSNEEKISFSSSLTEQDIKDLYSEYLDSNASFVEYTDPDTGETNYMLNIPKNASYEANSIGYTLVVDTDDANLDNNTAAFGEN